MKKYLLSIIVLILLSSNLIAAEGVTFKVDIYQFEKATETKHLIYTNSFDLSVGENISGFVGPVSLDIELLSADSIRTSFNAHLITHGSFAKTYSKSFSAEYGLPARVENIIGKNNSQFLLTISPMTYKSEIDIDCQYNHNLKEDFSVLPTAHTEIYYIKSTLAEFYWDSIKALLENNYELFRSFLHLNIPGKFHIFVPPCPTTSVIWDTRFGTSVDPTKSRSYAVYNKEYSTVDPFILNHLIAMKTYGYTAPFISEGLANYFSFGIFEMKKILNEKRNMPLGDILESHAYLTADPSIADRISTTFSRYLIDTYSLERFLELYEKADDINLAATLQDVYTKPVAELEQEWLTYVDTFTINIKTYKSFARVSEMMLDYRLMHTYYLASLENSVTHSDSLSAFSSLKRSSFFNGQFDDAVIYQQKLIQIKEKPTATDWMMMGAYSLMTGDNESAFASYTKATDLDSTNHVIKFNIALYYQTIGGTGKAKEILLSNFTDIKGASAQGETRILLAKILSESKENSDIVTARNYYKQAKNYYARLSQTNSSSPSAYMWLGNAYLGLDEYENAINNLQIARFIESRPLYYGMIDLLLGKAYKASGDNKQAKQYFNSVISNASSVYHQKEAKDLLEQLKK